MGDMGLLWGHYRGGQPHGVGGEKALGGMWGEMGLS